MEFVDCRSVLEWEFRRRRQRNHRYSLRAYARDLSLSPSYLCELLAGKYRLSLARAVEMLEALRFDDATRHRFLCLAAHEGATSLSA